MTGLMVTGVRYEGKSSIYWQFQEKIEIPFNHSNLRYECMLGLG
jgi:hypothetical protein